MDVLLIGLAAVASTLLGGAFALRFKDRLHLILGFSAGAVIGVAFLDMLPEAFALARASTEHWQPTTLAALGFLLYMVIDRAAAMHPGTADGLSGKRARGRLAAVSLLVHSFMDGAAIGLAFQVSASVGVVVAIAVVAHDFSDGINIVSVVLKGHTPRESVRWLAADALAPLLGVISTMFLTLPDSILGAVLAMFAGFFLYIGASELLPESYHAHPTKWTTVATILGVGVIYAAVSALPA